MKKTFITFMTIITLTICLTANTSAATAGWTDYLGFDGKPGHTWFEASNGKVSKVKKNSWTVSLIQIGWGGIWGGQMYRKVNVQKGERYRLKFQIKSTKVNKWVFIKIATHENFAYGKWIWLKKNKTKKVNIVFTAESTADKITFAFGGEYGDREAVDGSKHYSFGGGANKIAAKKDGGGDSGPHKRTFTKIIMKNYSLKKATVKKSTRKYICRCNCKYCCR